MKHVLFAGLLAGAALFAGCDGNSEPVQGPASDFKITFQARYDGQPLEKYKNYTYDSYQVQITRFNTFLSDITLLNGNKEVRISDIDWVDFTPDNAPNNLAVSVPLTFAQVPDGDYTGIRIGYGVRPDLNAKQPKDFAAGHPLSRENEYWLGWGSYIFNKIEGTVDLNNNNVSDGGLVYHCGSDATYRTYTFNTPITVQQGATATVTFDLKKLFDTTDPTGGWLDLNSAYNHVTSNDVSDVVIANLLMNKFDRATTV
ncbi:MAG: hypothetical protein IT260_11705, partial [Saprospiraceae bacterium]|nr:hypothetical protein [Saprospiraceae bacterium]